MAANQRTLAQRQTRPKNGVRLKTIALPAEHGGWGLLCEPIVLGLLLAPSIAGLYLALSAVGFFLARHPLTLGVLNRKRSSPRTALARRFATLYLVIGVASFVAAVAFTEHVFVLPLLIAAPLALVQLAHDWTGRRRVLLSELAGAVAISSLATTIALAGGWSSKTSFVLWAIMIARAVPAILYVRACLRRLRFSPVSPRPMIAAHLLAIGVALAFAAAGLGSPWVAMAMVLLLSRAVIGFAWAKTLTAKQLGFSEIAFGAMTIMIVVSTKYF
jgi:YwiC-like protein